MANHSEVSDKDRKERLQKTRAIVFVIFFSLLVVAVFAAAFFAFEYGVRWLIRFLISHEWTLLAVILGLLYLWYTFPGRRQRDETPMEDWRDEEDEGDD